MAFAVSAHGGKTRDRDRRTVIDAVVAHLDRDYVDPTTGARAARALAAEAQRGAFDDLSEGTAFAEVLTVRLQSLTGDGHLRVEYATERVDVEAMEAFTDEQLDRWYGAHVNFGVQRIERLDGNVGLLDLRVLAPLDRGAATMSAALQVLAHTDALILDLRRNAGGMGEMGAFVASHLFDETPRPLSGVYDRPSDHTTLHFTMPWVPGVRFGPDKPVYVLVSRDTFSAAEALAYDLQALDRAVIVGEPSGGGAHPFAYLPVHPHFVLWSVTERSVHPLTGSNWQGVGVQPDVVAPADAALRAALAHLRAHPTP